MSNPSANLRPKPVFQPLPKLQPLEIQSVEFKKSVHQDLKPALFQAWEVDENQSFGLKKTEHILNIESTPQTAAVQEADFQSSESFQKVDPTYVESVKNEAFQLGFLEGKRVQKEEYEKAEQDQHAAELETTAADAEKLNLHLTSVLAEISKCANELIQRPDQMHDPLKRLALHLAEQITLAELSLSANSIHSLVERSIETLDLGHHVSLTLELNPADMSLLQNHITISGEEKTLWRLVADAHLLPGSVRVRADDSVVTDFIENRLESLAQSLLLEPSRWQNQSAFQPDRLSARINAASNVEDALPRTSQYIDQSLNDLEKDSQILDDSINQSKNPHNDND